MVVKVPNNAMPAPLNIHSLFSMIQLSIGSYWLL